MAKVALIGGGGARTPLLLHGLAQAQADIGIDEVALFDVDADAAQLMAELGREVVRQAGGSFSLQAAARIEDAIQGAAFVLSSIRVGGMAARARDERIVIEHGLAGQETTGPGGLAMALRTIPVALEHARLIEKLAPRAWLINFTNPAGLITQALLTHTNARVIGICDTPEELFHRIAWSLGLPYERMRFDYAGLNHLGWVRRVLLDGEDITDRLLSDETALLRVYPAHLFDPDMIRALRLIPTEYLFFYYGQHRAWENQQRAGASRGEEIQQMNAALFDRMRAALQRGDAAQAVRVYKDYLNQRNSSYMRLEAEAESGLQEREHDWNPFEGATGYHRIAIDVMRALSSDTPRKVVVNVRNGGAITDLLATDVVEAPSAIDRNGPRPLATGALPGTVQGLVLAVKEYERLAIQAAVTGSLEIAKLALLAYPIVGQWRIAGDVMNALRNASPGELGYLH